MIGNAALGGNTTIEILDVPPILSRHEVACRVLEAKFGYGDPVPEATSIRADRRR